jgi:hypothetical protein
MANVDGFCDRAEPNVVIFGVVKGHDGFHARPCVAVWMYAKAAVRRYAGNIGVHEAEALGRRYRG